jgi:AcrR family transcriptional regulator
LVRTAIEMLDDDGDVDLSIRAVALRAGVSSAAPYRHFPDRPALLAAVAAVGFDELMGALVAVHPEPASRDELADLAVAYVSFATSRPGLFGVMFGERCQRGDPRRREATARLHAYLDVAVRRVLGVEEPTPTTTGLWALVHGLACLYLDDNLEPASPEGVAARVRTTIRATLAIREQ